MASNLDEITFAQHDPMLCLAPGLFRSLKRGDRNQSQLDVTYKIGKKEKIKFHGPTLLGVDDLRVLQVIIALAGRVGDILTATPTEQAALKLREGLGLKNSELQTLAFESTYTQLVRHLGYKAGGSRLKAIQACVQRLCAVSITADTGGTTVQYQLLSSYTPPSTGKKLPSVFIAINPRTAAAIVDSQKKKYTRIELDEVRKLSSDPAYLLHQRLCAWINPGRSGKVSLKKLCDYVWFNETTKEDTLKKRKETIGKSLKELTQAGWTCTKSSSGIFTITRPSSQKPGKTRKKSQKSTPIMPLAMA